MDIQKIPIDKINPAVYNPRKDLQPGDPEYEKLKKSITEFDMVEPLVWNKQTGNLVGGHQRLKILKELDYSEVEVSVVDLSEVKEKALNLALNKISGEWDFPMLKDLLEELDTGDFDMEITGFDLKEIEDLMNQFHVPEEGQTDDDAVPEATESICRKGDLWQLGNHRLLCGDATVKEDVDKLMAGEKADMVFTDPPYGIDYDTTSTGRSKRKWKPIVADQESPDFVQSWLMNILECSLPISSFYICYSHLKQHILTKELDALNIHWCLPLIWAKNRIAITWDRYHPKHEIILYCGEGSKPTGSHSRWYGNNTEETVWQIDKDSLSDYAHPTQKPVALAARAIGNSSQLHNIVLDLFGGSGSTLITCEKLGRRCFMMEIDEHYCDVIIKRWEDFTGKTAERL